MSALNEVSVRERLPRWLLIAVVAYLSVTHVIQSIMILTMWAADNQPGLFNGTYLLEFLMLCVRVAASIFLVSAFTVRTQMFSLLIYGAAIVLLVTNLMFLGIDQIAWFSNDPYGINPILQNNVASGIALALVVFVARLVLMRSGNSKLSPK